MNVTSDRLAFVVNHSGLTIKEIAELLGCSTKQLARWCSGNAEMGIYKLKSFCDLFGISADYLLDIRY